MKAKELYNYIYSHAIPNRALYGAWGRRDTQFVEYIRDNVPKGSTILDASCGRGFLLRWLIADGYKAEGTEIADWLMNPGGDLYGMPVKELHYKDLGTIESEKYNVVVTNDVLEHLDNEDEIWDAMRELVRISKKWLLVSTGGTKAAGCPFRIELKISNLHYVIKPYEWWKELYEKYCVLNVEFERAGSHFFFGIKK